MSRIGNQIIVIPKGVEAIINGNNVTIKGPKGELTQDIHEHVIINQKDNEIKVAVKNKEEKFQKSLWGLSQRLIQNMVIGVSEGFSKKLEVNGVGYKAEVRGKVLHLNLGHSHPIDYDFPEGIDISVEKNAITITGIDKQKVGQTAAEIRLKRKPEPYKGKGIKYDDEIIRRKVGKAAGKGSD